MSSTFGSLNTAASGLYAAQRGIAVTGQNVANANTDGYSRQRVDLQSVGASVIPAIWSKSNAIGDGVNSDTVTRIQDQFLQAQAQQAHATSQQLTAQDSAYTQIQQTFGEPSTTGIQSQLSTMWGAWQDLANAPGSQASGSALLQSTQAVVDSFHQARASLDQQWGQTRDNLQALVTDVNSTTANIATLNQQIKVATLSGLDANELMDQRDGLVLQLSEQIGATSRPGDSGTVDVVVGGVSLVSGPTSTQVALAGPMSEDGMSTTPVAANDPNFMTTGLPRIVTAEGHAAVNAGGTAGGDLNTLTGIIPTYRDQLDGVASALASQVNAQQAVGYDGTGAHGSPMFGSSTAGPITAGSITLLSSSPSQIAASSVAPDASGTPATDGGNADLMSQLGSAATSPDTSYRSMITQLGVQAQSTSRNLTIQTTATATVDANRQSVSGVSIDEEMTNMLAFQQSYAASARLISTIDQNLSTLINMVGN